MTVDTRPFDLAGMTITGGVLGRPAAVEWRLPTRLGREDSGRLVYTRGARANTVSADARMLDSFLRLGDASDHEIAGFAAKYGVLDLCKHQLPARHSAGCSPAEDDDGRMWESMATWRDWSRRADAIMRVAAALRSEGVADPKFWSLALAGHPAASWQPEVVARPWWVLAGVLDGWISAAGVTFGLLPVPGGVTFVPEPGGLFGALGIQMALTTAGAAGMAACFGCGGLYAPSRKPRGESYCSDCRGRGVPARVRKQRERARAESAGPADVA